MTLAEVPGVAFAVVMGSVPANSGVYSDGYSEVQADSEVASVEDDFG